MVGRYILGVLHALLGVEVVSASRRAPAGFVPAQQGRPGQHRASSPPPPATLASTLSGALSSFETDIVSTLSGSVGTIITVSAAFMAFRWVWHQFRRAVR